MDDIKHVDLDLEGAACASCAYAIEKAGRKIEGIKDIRVDALNKKIHTDYSGDEGPLRRIVDIVEKLGYKASLPGK